MTWKYYFSNTSLVRMSKRQRGSIGHAPGGARSTFMLAVGVCERVCHATTTPLYGSVFHFGTREAVGVHG